MFPHEHALLALLWSEVDDNGTPFDSIDAPVSQALRDRIRDDWERFRETAESEGFDADEHCARMLHPDCEGDAWNAAAHDFTLTRNGHGTGFWDSGRWHAPWDQQLTGLARSFGELHCLVTDDGEINAE